MAKQFLIVGLGNPGEEYDRNRHNTGFMVVDELLGGGELSENKYLKSAVLKTKEGKSVVVLQKPLTFMNKSGLAVAAAQKEYKIEPENIILVHDDVDLPLGIIRISFGRGSGGHRGVHSVLKSLKTKNIVRVRVGVVPTTPTGKLKKPATGEKVLDHLMGDFKKSEDKKLFEVLSQAADAVRTIVAEGRVVAMNKFN